MHQSNPRWSERNKNIVPYIIPNSKIIDYGCGDKDFLNYYTPSKYLGIDLNPLADIVCDLETYQPNDDVYDYALVLGVLEYLNNPYDFIKRVKHTADTFIILHFHRDTKKSNWKQTFNKEDVISMYKDIFKDVEIKQIKRYDMYICKT